MGAAFQRFTQVFFFTVLSAVALGMCALRLRDPLPTAQEAPHLMAAANRAETLHVAEWPTGLCAAPTLFHAVAGAGARFFGVERQTLSTSCYRLIPMLCAMLFILGLPALGRRRDNGWFEFADGPLWSMAFAAVSLPIITAATQFMPEAFWGALFLFLLISARAYARWPGYLPAIGVGAAAAMLLAVSAQSIWVLLVLLPAVLLGVGWSHLCLYWRPLHVGLTVAIAVGGWSLFSHFGWIGSITPPVLPNSLAGLWEAIANRAYDACCGGLGVLAWMLLALFGSFRRERRWTRFVTVAFPLLFTASLFAPGGGIFSSALAFLTPALAGMALMLIPLSAVRAGLGAMIWGALFLLLRYNWQKNLAYWPTREEAQAGVALLRNAQDAPYRKGYRVRVVTDSPGVCAQLVWPLRKTARRVAYSDRLVVDDADILIVNEADLAQVPPSVGRQIRPGEVKTGGRESFRVFAVRAQQPEEAL